ncbi:two-component system cell cycle response regulator DivK [Rhodoferax ferrireducens]|uniref:Two-component system cell cycle response regulator DivK n=1 Tax=Rhodoferax ferrireducens TaxID=192843 RepID=A0ABU2C3V8_9BURK|nr:response regulator [Rhodoferax ferrireducens]MDR7375998.1 two-component system cell cycle response regulator DivK [Rhodoferax ferrireducens]
MAARILIIEDDYFSRELAMYLLQTAGYTVMGAEDGRTGVDMALQERPDLVLCDLQMPVLNGKEVVRRLHASPDWHRVPVLAVTAFSMAGDREAALAAGFDAHVTKPITPETFIPDMESFLPPELRAPRKSAL